VTLPIKYNSMLHPLLQRTACKVVRAELCSLPLGADDQGDIQECWACFEAAGTRLRGSRSDPLVARALGLPGPAKQQLVFSRPVPAVPDVSDAIADASERRRRPVRDDCAVIALACVPRETMVVSNMQCPR